MGLLDKKQRIIDMVLTERGRSLFSQGTLDFAYFAVFDDGVDYDPVPSTGSFSDADRDAQVETTVFLEAPYIRDQGGARGVFEPSSHVFTAADGFAAVPRIFPTTSSLDIVCVQVTGSDGGPLFVRKDSTAASVDLFLVDDPERSSAGFDVRIFASGSDGLTELLPIRDSKMRRSVDPFVVCSIDSEDGSGR